MSEKQSSQNTWICQKFHLFTYLGATNITSKQKSDMTKVAIKNVNITSFGGIYHIMDVFSKLGFEKLTESVLGKRRSSGKAFCYGSIFCGFLYFPIGLGGGFYAYARTKNPRKSPYQWINPKMSLQYTKVPHKE